MTTSETALSGRQSVQFGLLITALGGLLFTFDLPLLRLAETDKWTLVFVRGVMLFTSISLFWLVMRQRNGSTAPFVAGRAGWLVVLTNTIANICFIGAVIETYAANVVFILALTPILTAIFSRIFIGEKIHGFTWLASAVAFMGVGIIVHDGVQAGKYLGDLLALVCACCTAAAFTIIRASGKNVATSLGLGSLFSAIAALVLFPVNLASLLDSAGFGMPGLFWIALNGLVAIPLASSLIANGPRFLPSVDVSMFFLLETVLTPVWIWMIFGEHPPRAVTYGGLMIIFTLLAHSLWRLRLGLTRDTQFYRD